MILNLENLIHFYFIHAIYLSTYVCMQVYIYLLHRTACRILVSQPGIKPGPPAVEAWSPNHWTTREFPHTCYLNSWSVQCVCVVLHVLRAGWRKYRKITWKHEDNVKCNHWLSDHESNYIINRVRILVSLRNLNNTVFVLSYNFRRTVISSISLQVRTLLVTEVQQWQFLRKRVL